MHWLRINIFSENPDITSANLGIGVSFAGPLRRPSYLTEVKEGNQRPDIRIPQRICGL